MKAVFLDRDGVLNCDTGYLYKREDLRWTEGAGAALACMAARGYKIFVVTNQSGIARGFYTVADMKELHSHMQRELAAYGGNIEKFYYCPHHKDGVIAEYAVDCDCRKPKPGMLLQAMAEYDIDKEKSFLIGDSLRDIEAAEAAGICGYLFPGGDLADFVKDVFKQRETRKAGGVEK